MAANRAIPGGGVKGQALRVVTASSAPREACGRSLVQPKSIDLGPLPSGMFSLKGGEYQVPIQLSSSNGNVSLLYIYKIVIV